MRLLLDTCAVIDILTDPENLGTGAVDLVRDPNNMLFASFETLRELIVHFNNKRLLSRQWKTAQEMIDYVENDLEIEFLPLRSRVGYTYANLRLNIEQEHHDPSDHIIISHAITEHIALLSSDTRFWFYRNQGLDLIEY
ncbi:MAG: PIN domain-containing protein [Prevotella sp.]|nr:PIN domain-containing protein [Prevotella sp.]